MIRRLYEALRANPLTAVGIAIGLALVSAVATYNTLTNLKQDRQITRIVETPCARDPRSAECRRIQRDTYRAIPPQVACILVRKTLHPGPAINATVCARSRGERRGVMPQSPPQGQRPGGSGPPTKPPTRPPPAPPPAPKPQPKPGPVGQVLRTVCHVSVAGVRVCVKTP